jgi:hypothetical protein
MKRAVSDLKKSAEAHKATSRVDRDLNAKVVFAGVGLVFLAMIGSTTISSRARTI